MTDFGTVRRDGSFGAVRFERVYAAAPEELWDAWTAPERIPRWLGASLVGSLAAGSTARLVWGDDPDSQVDLLVQEHKPPRLLEWQWTINGEPPTLLRVELTPAGDGTLLVLDHSRLPVTQFAGLSAGGTTSSTCSRPGRRRPRTGGGSCFRRTRRGWQNSEPGPVPAGYPARMPVPVPTETSRWRCTLCGNLTRFDVQRSTRAREYVHVSLAGEPVVEDRQVLAETVEQVTCRWCGRADSVEVAPRPGEPGAAEGAGRGAAAAVTGEPAEHPASS